MTRTLNRFQGPAPGTDSMVEVTDGRNRIPCCRSKLSFYFSDDGGRIHSTSLRPGSLIPRQETRNRVGTSTWDNQYSLRC